MYAVYVGAEVEDTSFAQHSVPIAQNDKTTP